MDGTERPDAAKGVGFGSTDTDERMAGEAQALPDVLRLQPNRRAIGGKAPGIGLADSPVHD